MIGLRHPVWLVLGLVGSAALAGHGEVVKKKTVSHPGWNVSLEVPGYKVFKDHPLRGQANLVAAGTSDRGGCHLVLSMFAIPIEPGQTTRECREGYMGNPEPLRDKPEVTLHEAEESPVMYTLFDLKISEEYVQQKLYGYWSRTETCFELHVSSSGCSSFRDLALPILQSVRIADDPDATLETVAVAMMNDADPHDWQVHAEVAAYYLHEMDPEVPDRSRRFYESARRLGGDSLDASDEWLIEEGIGLTWLIEDAGAEAIPHLERSLKIAEEHGGDRVSLDSSLYNLACAHALVGDTDRACELLGRMLAGQGKSERKDSLKEIRADPQLKTVTEDPCFEAILPPARGKP